jgi:outer membrane protein insertion porin family
VYLRTTEPPALNIGSYTIKQTGGRVSFGVPFSEVDTVFFGIGLERSRSPPTSPADALQGIRDRSTAPPGVGTATTNAVPLTVAWARDSRDSP